MSWVGVPTSLEPDDIVARLEFTVEESRVTHFAFVPLVSTPDEPALLDEALSILRRQIPIDLGLDGRGLTAPLRQIASGSLHPLCLDVPMLADGTYMWLPSPVRRPEGGHVRPVGDLPAAVERAQAIILVWLLRGYP